jgi:C-terminal processing protease CtpA/Prc
MKFPVAFALVAVPLLPCSILQAQTPAATPAKSIPAATRGLLDSLSDADLDEVINLLKDNYVKPDALTDVELHRATVQGLLNRLAPGVSLLETSAAQETAASPFRSEITDNRIGYARLGAISPGNVTELDAALQKFTEAKLPAVILDLRATPAGSDFEQTAEVCRRFCPKGKILFSVKKPNAKEEQILTSKEDPKYQGILVALVDRSTAGDGEVIAAVLRTHVHAMVIGQQTRGEAAEFAEFPFANGKVLRVAVAEVALPEGGAPVFPGGVKPDLPVDAPEEATKALLKQELDKGVSAFVFDTERPRLNEAALVAGSNPELDAVQQAQKSKAEKTSPPPRDVVLQRAVDFITTITIYEKKPAAK